LIFKYSSKSKNPFYNIALEDFFFDFVNQKPDNIVLYFWQNQDTVVIGRNQDVFAECNFDFMKEKNIKLVRRKTGGGAVFHDSENLNFTFAVPKKYYNKEKTMNIIISALKKLGFDAYLSGRNDILVNNKKISGNAYYNGKNATLHHGTILVNTNFEKMLNSLTPDISKLKSNGVKSVKSRVLNLSEIKKINVDDIKNAIEKEFLNFFIEQQNSENLQENKIGKFTIKNSKNKIKKIQKEYMSKKWIFGGSVNYFMIAKQKFDWGLCEIKMNNEGHYKIFSDSLDVISIENAQKILNKETVYKETENKITDDIIKLLN